MSASTWKKKYNSFYKHNKNPFKISNYYKMFDQPVPEAASAVNSSATKSTHKENLSKKWKNKNHKIPLPFCPQNSSPQNPYSQAPKVKVNSLPPNT